MKMNLRRALFTLGFLFTGVFFTLAQNGSINGVVTDSENGTGVPFASVALLQPGSTEPVTGVITNLEGQFLLSGLAHNTYTLTVSFIGYETQRIDSILVTNVSPTVEIGAVRLSPVKVQLEEVVVSATALTAVSGLDRRTYRAGDFETARGGTAADVLNRLPSVSVSPEGDVSVRGTTDFMVYLNGRPTQIEPSLLLAQIAAGTIESVDIITVPTAKYDAQGKGGIININTKAKGVKGFSLSANALAGGAPWGNRTDPYSGYGLSDNRYGGGFNLMYADNGWLFYGGLNYNWKDVNASRTGDARIFNAANDTYKHMVAAGMKPEWNENISASMGFDANLNQRSSLSASYYYGNRTEGRQAFYLYNIFTADVDKNPIDGIPVDEQWIFNPNEGIRKGIFHTFSSEYSHSFTPAARLSLSGLYEHSVLSHDIDNPNIAYSPLTGGLAEHLDHYKQSDNTPLDGLRFSADFAWDISSSGTLNLGFQPQYFAIAGGFDYDTLNVESGTWGAYTDLENSIEMTRVIMAGYADFSGTQGKLKYKAGLRLEHTDQMLEIDNPDYFTIFDRPTQATNEQNYLDWFPSLHLSYPVFRSDNLSFAASRRISRAPVKNMAPFLYRRHLEVYVVGDPALKPEYINTVELSYGKSLGNQRIAITGFYRGVDNAVFRVNTVYEEEMVLIRSFTNAGNTTAIGAELNANIELGPKARLFLGGSLYDYHVQADIFGYREDQRSLSWNLKGSANITVARGVRLSADFDMVSAQVTAQGRNEMRYIANAAVSYNPQKYQAWNITLRGLNLLNSNIRELNTRAYNSEGVQIFYQDTEFYFYGPIAELGISYNLNWKGPVRKTESEFGKGEF